MELFTVDHIQEEQKRLYNNEDYSRGFLFLIEPLTEFIQENQFSEVLDYGAGLARPAQLLDFEYPVQYYPYDPAIPEFSERPLPKQLTIALNALEYCEPNFVDAVIDDLASLTKQSTFIAINTRFPGGIPPKVNRNSSWWIQQLVKAFELKYFRKVGDGFITIAKSLKNLKPESESKLFDHGHNNKDSINNIASISTPRH